MVAFSSLYGALLNQELGSADSTQLFTTARRQAAVNRGQVEFAELTECLIRRSTVTITGGTSEYDLNSTVTLPGGDFIRLAVDGVEFRYTDASSNVTILADDSLPRRDIPWLNKYESGWRLATVASSVRQLPSKYYLRYDGPAVFLGFTPQPSTGSSASASAMVSYHALPAAMTSDTQEPYIVNSSVRRDLRPYHQALVHYGAYQLEKLRRDEQASQSQLQIFLGYVTRYLQQRRIKGGRAVMQGKSYFADARGPR